MRMGTGSHVRIVVDHEVVREVVLRPPMTFGRSKDNDVVLDDEAVSAKHGRVEQGAHGWRYIDCFSANGTLVAVGPHLGPGESTDLAEDTWARVGRICVATGGEFRWGPRGIPGHASERSSTPHEGHRGRRSAAHPDVRVPDPEHEGLCIACPRVVRSRWDRSAPGAPICDLKALDTRKTGYP